MPRGIREINTLLARIQLKANAPDKERQLARALLGIFALLSASMTLS